MNDIERVKLLESIISTYIHTKYKEKAPTELDFNNECWMIRRALNSLVHVTDKEFCDILCRLESYCMW